MATRGRPRELFSKAIPATEHASSSRHTNSNHLSVGGAGIYAHPPSKVNKSCRSGLETATLPQIGPPEVSSRRAAARRPGPRLGSGPRPQRRGNIVKISTKTPARNRSPRKRTASPTANPGCSADPAFASRGARRRCPTGWEGAPDSRNCRCVPTGSRTTSPTRRRHGESDTSTRSLSAISEWRRSTFTIGITPGIRGNANRFQRGGGAGAGLRIETR
jgi:hypothetical protein